MNVFLLRILVLIGEAFVLYYCFALHYYFSFHSCSECGIVEIKM